MFRRSGISEPLKEPAKIQSGGTRRRGSLPGEKFVRKVPTRQWVGGVIEFLLKIKTECHLLFTLKPGQFGLVRIETILVGLHALPVRGVLGLKAGVAGQRDVLVDPGYPVPCGYLQYVPRCRQPPPRRQQPLRPVLSRRTVGSGPASR